MIVRIEKREARLSGLTAALFAQLRKIPLPS